MPNESNRPKKRCAAQGWRSSRHEAGSRGPGLRRWRAIGPILSWLAPRAGDEDGTTATPVTIEARARLRLNQTHAQQNARAPAGHRLRGDAAFLLVSLLMFAVTWIAPVARAADAPIAPTIDRYAGASRFDTAAVISAHTFAPGVEVAYLAYAFNFPDALAGAAAAGTVKGPVLLVSQSGAINPATAAELTRLQPGRIVALGGVSVVSDAVLCTAAGLTPPVPPLPACSYQDLVTSRGSYSQYPTTLLDTIYTLPKSYAPGDLVSTGLSGGGLVRGIVSVDLKAMVGAASAARARLANVSAYRSYTTQISTFAYWVSVGGMAAALKTSARAGHSEHQLGTVIDFSTYGGGSPFKGDWATTTAGAWMQVNAWQYGWVMSYPKGKTSVTCYAYEPWHYRYVGRIEAKAIHDSGLTTREWIWINSGS